VVVGSSAWFCGLAIVCVWLCMSTRGFAQLCVDLLGRAWSYDFVCLCAFLRVVVFVGPCSCVLRRASIRLLVRAFVDVCNLQDFAKLQLNLLVNHVNRYFFGSATVYECVSASHCGYLRALPRGAMCVCVIVFAEHLNARRVLY